MTALRRVTTIALVGVGLALLAGTPAATASNRDWTPQDLESQLMCPTCHVPLDQSDSQAARDIRNFIQQRHEAGWSERRTKQALVNRFGTAILAAPPFSGFDALAWLIPALILAVGAAIAVGLAWTWTHRRRTPTVAEQSTAVDPALLARIEADLDHLD
jgi:cytochrome c-type biogenesis protein CcmH/NrfF